MGKSAAEWLVDMVRAHPGELSVLALGPLTNIALALQLDATVTRNLVRPHAAHATCPACTLHVTRVNLRKPDGGITASCAGESAGHLYACSTRPSLHDVHSAISLSGADRGLTQFCHRQSS